MPVLVVTSKDNVTTYVLEEGKPLFIGRSKECDIVLPSTAVSRRHAVILYKNGICGVKDLGSFNGTSLNNKIIQEPHHLTGNDILRISSFLIQLHTKDPNLAVLESSESGQHGGDTSSPRSVRIDSRKFEDSGLHLPRAMQRQQELSRSMKSILKVEPNLRDTSAFIPGAETAAFIKTKPKADAPVDIPADNEAPGYFTPFPVPETGTFRHVPPTESGPAEDLSDFEESPLAHLEDINRFSEPEPTPFLASAGNFDAVNEFVASMSSEAESIIPMGADYQDEMINLSSDAEAIIPLIDDTPLVSTLRNDGLDDDHDDDHDDELLYENAPLPPVNVPDTGTYALPAGADEPENISDTGNYQLAEAPSSPPTELELPVIPDTAGPDMGPDTGSETEADSERRTGSDTDFTQAGPDDTDDFEPAADDEFGEHPIPANSESSRIVANIGRIGSSKGSIKGKSYLSGIASITISSALMEAINTRLSLYSLLFDLMEERRRFREEHPILAEDVEEELNRQDAEVENLPTAEEADRHLQNLRERNDELEQAIAQAAEAGVPGPPRPTEEMLFAEDLAVSQWLLVGDSNRQALPAIYREAYTLATDEPLVKELSAAKIAHGRMMGGAIYLLALEALAAIANKERFRIAKKIRKLSEPETDEGEGFFGKLGSLGKKAENFMNRNLIREQIERLENEDQINVIRGQLANREARFMEKTLSREFRQVYKKTALRYIPEFDTMPPPVRAFLRHGVIGFSPWWMTKETRDYIIRDCTDNVLPEFLHGTGDMNVLYADEYIFAVSQMECAPSPDEDLLSSSLNSTEWKTDRAYRRIVNARTYDVLMEEMINQLDLTSKYLLEEETKLEKRIEEIKHSDFSAGGQVFDIQTERQQYQTRRLGIDRNLGRIKEELIPSILEAIEDAERRFRTGDLRIPDQETLIRREVDALFRIGRRMEGDLERFMPMAVREHYRFKSDTINDRVGVRSIIVKMEELDPDIFMRTIIPSKHKRKRVNLRMSPTFILFPSAGENCVCSMAREGMESGHLVAPTCFIKQGVRTRLITHMLADFRWESARVEAGRDAAKSDSLVGVFTKLRKGAEQLDKGLREKKLLFTEIEAKENWRRVYEVYLPDALNGGRLLFQRNPELYEAIVGKYLSPPEGVKILRRG